MDVSKLKLPLQTCKSSSQLELMKNQQSKSPTSVHSRGSFSFGDTFTEYSSKLGEASRNLTSKLSSKERRQSSRTRRRIVHKNGDYNISHENISKRHQRYLADIFTTLVDIKWRWNLLVFILAFMLSWHVFAFVWWLICFTHGDLENYGVADWKPCVEEVHDFTTALLFSIETQHTIGYGGRQTTQYCPQAILTMMLQSCFGVIIQALMTGLVFAKLSRPKKRAETLMFSKNAVVCRRDGQLCLLFRVGDMRKSHIVEAHVHAVLVKMRTTQEGEVMPLCQQPLQISDGGGDVELDSRVFLVWPIIVEHPIDESSPFWDMSAEELRREQFELIIILEGVVECTGMTTQARTSYVPEEILWGHRFEKLVNYRRHHGHFEIDYSRFHGTVPVDIPECSAKTLAKLQETSTYMDGICEKLEEDEENNTASVTSSSTAEEPLTVVAEASFDHESNTPTSTMNSDEIETYPQECMENVRTV